MGEEVISEMDPGFVSRTVTALREDKWDLSLLQHLLVCFRDKTPVKDKDGASSIDPASVTPSLTEPGSVRIITGSRVSAALKRAMLICGNQTPSAL